MGDEEYFSTVVARTKGQTGKSARSVSPPRRYVPVGGVFRSGSADYLVVARGRMGFASQACIGCAFRDRYCPNVPCSAFDRPDGLFVWFVKKED